MALASYLIALDADKQYNVCSGLLKSVYIFQKKMYIVLKSDSAKLKNGSTVNIVTVS